MQWHSLKYRLVCALTIALAVLGFTFPRTIGVGIGIAVGLVVSGSMLYLRVINRRDRSRGWRVRGTGGKEPDLHYGEYRDGAWRSFWIGLGDTPHVIYPKHIEYPEWAAGREKEILARIKSACPPGKFRYWEGECPAWCKTDFPHTHDDATKTPITGADR